MATFIDRNGSTLAQVRITAGGARVFSRSKTFKTPEAAREWAASVQIKAHAALAGGVDPSCEDDRDRKALAAIADRENKVALREKLVGDMVEFLNLVLSATGVTSGPGIYILLDDRRKVIYVGQSNAVIKRIGGHQEKGFAHIRMIAERDRGRRLSLEARLIAALDPPLNRQLKLSAFTMAENHTASCDYLGQEA